MSQSRPMARGSAAETSPKPPTLTKSPNSGVTNRILTGRMPLLLRRPQPRGTAQLSIVLLEGMNGRIAGKFHRTHCFARERTQADSEALHLFGIRHLRLG